MMCRLKEENDGGSSNTSGVQYCTYLRQATPPGPKEVGLRRPLETRNSYAAMSFPNLTFCVSQYAMRRLTISDFSHYSQMSSRSNLGSSLGQPAGHFVLEQVFSYTSNHHHNRRNYNHALIIVSTERLNVCYTSLRKLFFIGHTFTDRTRLTLIALKFTHQCIRDSKGIVTASMKNET